MAQPHGQKENLPLNMQDNDTEMHSLQRSVASVTIDVPTKPSTLVSLNSTSRGSSKRSISQIPDETDHRFIPTRHGTSNNSRTRRNFRRKPVSTEKLHQSVPDSILSIHSKVSTVTERPFNDVRRKASEPVSNIEPSCPFGAPAETRSRSENVSNVTAETVFAQKHVTNKTATTSLCSDKKEPYHMSLGMGSLIDGPEVRQREADIQQKPKGLEETLRVIADAKEESSSEGKEQSGLTSDEAPMFEGYENASLVNTGLRAESGSENPRPKLCTDIGDPVKDMLFLSNIPRGMTYDRLMSIVEPYGEVSQLLWDANEPDVAEVVFEDPQSASEAMQYLDEALVEGEESLLHAEIRGRDPGVQLFVGDLTPDVTETMLESAFSKLVAAPVSANLKRDPDTFSPIGYGFLTFDSEERADQALIEGHRLRVGNANVRVGRAERNTFLYVTDLNPSVTMEDIKDTFAEFGEIVEEDTVVVHRAYAFVRYRSRVSAEQAKRSLDKTDMNGKVTVRYAEAEPIRSTVQVQFHSSVSRPPSSLRDLLLSTFSKYGNCSVEIPRMHTGVWRRVAFVQFQGEPVCAALAATEAIQNVKHVSAIPVLCQFARELIPRVPPKGLGRMPRYSNSPPGFSRRREAQETVHSRLNREAGTSVPSRRDLEGTPIASASRSRIFSNAVERSAERKETLSGKEEAIANARQFLKDGEMSDARVKEGSSQGSASFSPRQDVAECPQGYEQLPFQRSYFRRQQRPGSRDTNRPEIACRHPRPSQSMGGEQDMTYVPVYMPVSAVGNPYAVSGMPGLLTETEYAATTSVFASQSYGAQSLGPPLYVNSEGYPAPQMNNLPASPAAPGYGMHPVGPGPPLG